MHCLASLCFNFTENKYFVKEKPILRYLGTNRLISIFLRSKRGESERSSYLHSPNILLSSVAFAKNLDILIFAETQHGIGIGMIFQQSSAFRNDSWKIKKSFNEGQVFFSSAFLSRLRFVFTITMRISTSLNVQNLGCHEA